MQHRGAPGLGLWERGVAPLSTPRPSPGRCASTVGWGGGLWAPGLGAPGLSAVHLSRPSPSDNVDDPTGNFRGGPLTGWRVFLLLLCALLGIIVCAVVGAVVFQKRQDRNKRFY